MKPTRIQNNIRTDDDQQLPSPEMDGSWCLVTDEPDEADMPSAQPESGRQSPGEWQDAGAHDTLMDLLAQGIDGTPPPALPAQNEPSTTPASPPEEKLRAHQQMAQSAHFVREEEDRAPPQDLSRSLVANEAEALRRAATAAPAEWGCEATANTQHRRPAPLSNSQANSVEDLRDSHHGRFRHPELENQERDSTPSTPERNRPFWGAPRQPISPALQPTISHWLPPPMLDQESSASSQDQKPEGELQDLGTPRTQSPQCHDPRGDEYDMLWTVVKYVALVGGALYLGNKARKRWASSRV